MTKERTGKSGKTGRISARLDDSTVIRLKRITEASKLKLSTLIDESIKAELPKLERRYLKKAA